MKIIQGAPFQIDNRVKVVSLSDEMGDTSLIGKIGRVVKLSYRAGVGESFPKDPFIMLRFRNGKTDGFWKEELE